MVMVCCCVCLMFDLLSMVKGSVGGSGHDQNYGKGPSENDRVKDVQLLLE